jgi:hypothetical protein
VYKGVTALALLTLAVLLAGCPKPAVKDVVISGKPTGTEVSGAPAGGTETPAASAEDADSETAPAVEAAPDTDPVPDAGELTGKWFALYGRHTLGPAEFTYEDGHTVEFFPDGTAVWSIFRSGADISHMGSRFSLRGDTLSMTFSPAEDSSKEYSQLTPLGFGRDQEIGLTSAGRDQEIGLADQQAGGEARGAYKLDLDVSSDGQFLSMTGDGGKLMVYGRDDSPSAGSVPAINGEWLGHMSAHETFPATFEINGSDLTMTYGGDDPVGARGTFRGTFTHGYFVGELVSEREPSFAALTPTATGALNGVYTPDPYRELKLHFDFTPIK